MLRLWHDMCFKLAVAIVPNVYKEEIMAKFPKLLSGMLIATSVVGISMQSAHAYYVFDEKLGSLEQNQLNPPSNGSSPTNELAGLLQFITLDPSQTLVADQVDSGFTAQSNGFGSWYIDIAPKTTGYFVLKFGTGRTPSYTETHYYFRNIGELDKLVWTNIQVDGLSGGWWNDYGNIGRLSHYTLFSDPGKKTPEPGTALLIGLGLFGIAAMRRRKQQQ
jgi:hypothetical protein